MTEKKERKSLYGEGEGKLYSDLPEICTPDEVAEFFRVGKPQVLKWLRQDNKIIDTDKKHFPNAFKIGIAWRIPKKDVYSLTQKLYGDQRK